MKKRICKTPTLGLAIVAATILAGCSQEPEAKQPVMLNPGGQATTPRDSDLARKNEEMGRRSVEEGNAAAKAMKEAMARTGGK